jgi:hypothetical protein
MEGPSACPIVSRPAAAEPLERSGHRALDCRGSGYFLIVFGFGPVTWVRPARV